MKVLRQYSPVLSASSRTLHQEVFENKHTVATLQRTAATYACYRAIRCWLGREFDPYNFVLRPTVGTIERHRLWIRHTRCHQIADHRRPIDGQVLKLNHIR